MIQEREYFYTWRSRGETDPLWHWILRQGILRATRFEARFPDDPQLGQGRAEFSRLPGIVEEPWEGMEGAVRIRGAMTREARSLFLAIADGDGIRLWDFILFEGPRKLLAVDDFHDRFVTGYFARKFMKELFDLWFEPVPAAQEEPDTRWPPRVRDRARDLLYALRDAIAAALSVLKRELPENAQGDEGGGTSGVSAGNPAGDRGG